MLVRLLKSQETNYSSTFLRTVTDIPDTGARNRKTCHLTKLVLLLRFPLCWAEFWIHQHFQPTSRIVLSEEREADEERVGPLSFLKSDSCS